jgi:hypothetical protein
MSESSDPSCFILRTEAAPASGPNSSLVEPYRSAFASPRSVTLDTPISATVILAEIAEQLVRAVLADHPNEKTISLLAISVSRLEEHWNVQLELPLGLQDEARRPGTKRGMARWVADRAVDRIRDRFGWDLSDMRRWHWGLPVRSPTSFASSPNGTCDHHRSRRKARLCGCL